VPYVVFDTPPTIPGLSRAVLNLVFRLSRDLNVLPAEDGFIPYPLDEAIIEWKSMQVGTQDMQGIRAAALLAVCEGLSGLKERWPREWVTRRGGCMHAREPNGSLDAGDACLCATRRGHSTWGMRACA